MKEFLVDFFSFLKTRKKFWLLPLILILLLLSAIIIFSSGTVLAPFIYTLF